MSVSITSRGVAIVCGALLGAFGALGFLVPPDSAAEVNYLLASWLLPITLFPAAALAASLDAGAPRSVRGQASMIWPAYMGMVLYAVGAGGRWFDAAGRATHENGTGLLLYLVMAVHAAVLLAGGMALVPFEKTRPAAFQMWIGYLVLVVCWVAGSFVS